MRDANESFFLLVATALLLGACGSGASNPTKARQTYGTAVDATDAIPAVAVAAEAELYAEQPLTVDGRIASVRDDGCALQLKTEGQPLVVTAVQTEAEGCAWKVPVGKDGIAAAAGSLRADTDTLRVVASGVEIAPLRLSDSDS